MLECLCNFNKYFRSLALHSLNITELVSLKYEEHMTSKIAVNVRAIKFKYYWR